MTKKKSRTDSTADNTKENDEFSTLMRKSGITRLQAEPSKQQKKVPPDSTIKPVDFDVSYDWTRELRNISPEKKFSGRKPASRPRHAKKLKITREFSPDDILDLHGETIESALRKVQHAIHISEQDNYRALLIITGKGINSREPGGVLGKAVWNWLAFYQTDHSIRFQWAPHFLGGKGAILVIF